MKLWVPDRETNLDTLRVRVSFPFLFQCPPETSVVRHTTVSVGGVVASLLATDRTAVLPT